MIRTYYPSVAGVLASLLVAGTLFLGCLATALETDRTVWLTLAAILPLGALGLLCWSIHGHWFSFDPARQVVSIDGRYFMVFTGSHRTVPFAEIASLAWDDDSESGGYLIMRLRDRRTYYVTGSRKRAAEIRCLIAAEDRLSTAPGR